jgi:glycosyltransferase involved in cell wall biosynthesis
MTPFFSILMPAYNRAGFVGRALKSCIGQDFADWEAIVVDDGSEDDTAGAVRRLADPRIRLVRHERNRGPCPARNTAMAEARGRWFVFLDSDDELLPGALAAMHRKAVAAPSYVGGLRFMCRDSHGRTSPDPAHADETWDYEGYIRWTERLRGRPSEALPCVRAETYPFITYPDDHSVEGLYHLDLARHWGVMACADVVRLYHYDAGNRLMVVDARRSLHHARDAASNAERVLTRHGDALRAWAPGVLLEQVRSAATWALLAGRRTAGLRFARTYLSSAGPSVKVYVILAAGLVHPIVLAWVRHVGSRARRRQIFGSPG